MPISRPAVEKSSTPMSAQVANTHTMIGMNARLKSLMYSCFSVSKTLTWMMSETAATVEG